MIGEASAAISSIKAALDIAKGVSSLKTATDVNLAVIDIQRALLDAQLAAFEDRERHAVQQQRIAELEAKLSQIDQWEAEKARYVLTETPTGKLVYALKPDCANGEPDHRICVKCFNENRKSVLQVTARHSGGEAVICENCQTKATLSPFPKTELDFGRFSNRSSIF